MKTNRPLYILLALALSYLIVSCWLAHSMSSAANAGVDIKRESTIVLNFEKRLLNPKEWVSSEDEWNKKRDSSEAFLKYAEQDAKKAANYSMYIIAGSIGFFLIVFFVYLGNVNFYRSISLTLVCIGLVCVYAGVTAPMIEISAFNEDLTIPIKLPMKDIPLLGNFSFTKDRIIDFSKTFQGRTYFYYQCKSIAELIVLLFKEKNMVVGISILCFSVLIPVLKLLLTVAILMSDKIRRCTTFVNIVNIIGKWSMADVFVVASYLTFLSFSNMDSGAQTEATIMIGLYYFLAYVILAITSTIIMSKVIKEEKGAVNQPLSDVSSN